MHLIMTSRKTRSIVDMSPIINLSNLISMHKNKKTFVSLQNNAQYTHNCNYHTSHGGDKLEKC